MHWCCTRTASGGVDPRGAMFGEERLVEAARVHLGGWAQGLLDGVVETVRAFVGDAPQADDITVMVIVREPSA